MDGGVFFRFLPFHFVVHMRIQVTVSSNFFVAVVVDGKTFLGGFSHMLSLRF